MLTATMRLPAVRVPDWAREHWLTSAVLVLASLLYLVAGISVSSLATPDGRARAQGPVVSAKVPPAPEPLKFKDVKPEDAVAINAAIPIQDLNNPAARPFILSASSTLDGKRSLECLTAAIYYEAATEGVEGQRAVAQVVLNRVRHPAYPSSVCGVVFQGSERSTGCQFTFTCDGSLSRVPQASYWARAKAVAAAALAGSVYAPVGWATHYHTNWVVPYWSSSLVKLANVGTHIFYRWEGGWGRGPAFTSIHTGKEPVLTKMKYIGVGGPIEEELTVDEQAALAAAEALPMNDDGTIADTMTAETMKRMVIRRFEPVKREDLKTVLAKQTPAGSKVEEGHRWAITGDSTSNDALGKPAAPAEAAAGAAKTTTN